MTPAEIMLRETVDWSDVPRGMAVHRINAATAGLEAGVLASWFAAQALRPQSSTSGLLSLALVMGTMCQESRFDPTAIDQNLSPQHPTPAFATTDWGLVQIDGLYLPSYTGMAGLTQPAMIARSQDPEWAIPTLATALLDRLVWAAPVVAAYLSRLEVDRPDHGEAWYTQWVAAQSYNAGETGTINQLKAGVFDPYADDVLGFAVTFAALLERPD